MRYFDTFSGIGGFPLGIELAYESLYCRHKTDDEGKGAEDIRQNLSRPQRNDVEGAVQCIGYSEIDKYASQIYQRHFPNHTNYGDITKINAKELPDFDLLVGGFPCQAFSIAGKRGGFEDTRGTMFFELARILKAKQPRLFVFENVKGLLSHDGGKSFATIIQTLDELGYDCQWQVLNSKNHGVPQNRERVFIVGHLRGTSRPQVFPFGEDDRGVTERKSTLSRKVQSEESRPTSGHSDESLSQNGKDRHIHQLNQPTHSNDRVYGTDGVSPTLNTMQGGNRQPFISEETKIRRLTPTECERLQGFPDGWTEGISDTQRYKCLGNAVTTNVIRDIFLRLL